MSFAIFRYDQQNLRLYYVTDKHEGRKCSQIKVSPPTLLLLFPTKLHSSMSSVLIIGYRIWTWVRCLFFTLLSYVRNALNPSRNGQLSWIYTDWHILAELNHSSLGSSFQRRRLAFTKLPYFVSNTDNIFIRTPNNSRQSTPIQMLPWGSF